MKKQKMFKIISVASLAFVALFAILFSLTAGPAAAEVQTVNGWIPALQETVVVPPDTDGDTVIVPDTGNPNQGILSNWIVWLVLGLAVAALLVAVVSRAAAPPAAHHHDHHHDDFIE